MGEPALNLPNPEESENGSPLSVELGDDNSEGAPPDLTKEQLSVVQQPVADDPGDGFDDGTPQSVNLQPNQANLTLETGGMADSGIRRPKEQDPRLRVTQQGQQGLAPDAPDIPGAKGANPFNTKKNASLKKAGKLSQATSELSKGDIAGAALDGAKGKLGDNAVGHGADKAIEATETAVEVLSLFEGNLLALRDLGGKLWRWMKKHWLVIMIIALLLLLPEISLGLALVQTLGGHGDKPGGVAVGSGTQYPGSSCAEMAPTLDTTYKGQSTHLFISGTTGLFSLESDVDANGMLKDDKPPTQLAFWDQLPQDHSPDIAKWFITARWPYTGWNWKGGSSSAGFDGLPPAAAFAGKKAIIFNPATGKAVLAVIMESGPAPYTGVLADDATAQRNLWEGAGSKGGYRIYDPVGFKGRVAGGTQAMETALGASNTSGTIEFGFAPDSWNNPSDTHPLGPLQCTIVKHSTGTAAGVLAVPGVKQGSEGECGAASAVAVSLFYNPAYSDPKLYDPTAHSTLATVSQACGDSNLNYLNKHDGLLSDPFVDATLAGENTITFQQVINSLQGGDPVIMYSGPDAIYGSAEHIFVLTGYNASDGTFDVMSPNVGRFDMLTGKDSKGNPLTADVLTKDAHYPSGKVFLIRKHWTNS